MNAPLLPTLPPALNAVVGSLCDFLFLGAIAGFSLLLVLGALRRESVFLRYRVANLGFLALAVLPVLLSVQAIRGGAESSRGAMALEQVTPDASIGTDLRDRAAMGSTAATGGGTIESTEPGDLRASRAGGVWTRAVASLRTLWFRWGFALQSVRDAVQPSLVWIGLVWLGGVLVGGVRLILAARQLQHLVRRAGPAGPAWTEMVETGARQLGLSSAPRVHVSDGVGIPVVLGLFQPRILVPADRDPDRDPASARALILHELAHVTRRDAWHNAFQVGVETLLFFHPLVRMLSSRLRALREQCCDEIAARGLGDRVLYARALVDLESARGLSRQLVLAAGSGTVRERVERLVQTPSHAGRRPRVWLAFLLPAWFALAYGIAVGSTGRWEPAAAHTAGPANVMEPGAAAGARELLDQLASRHGTDSWTREDFDRAIDAAIGERDDLRTLDLFWLSRGTERMRSFDRKSMLRLWGVADAYYRRYTESVTTPANIDSLYNMLSPWNEVGPGFAFGGSRGDSLGTIYFGSPGTFDAPQVRVEPSPFRLRADLDLDGAIDVEFDGVEARFAPGLEPWVDAKDRRTQYLLARPGQDPREEPYFLLYRDGPFWMFLLDTDGDGRGDCGRSDWIRPE